MAALESSVAPIASVDIPDPTNKQMTESLNEDEDASDEEVTAATTAAKTGPTFRSMAGALDSDDKLEKEDDKSDHPSQPSDDSRAEKNTTLTPV